MSASPWWVIDPRGPHGPLALQPKRIGFSLSTLATTSLDSWVLQEPSSVQPCHPLSNIHKFEGLASLAHSGVQHNFACETNLDKPVPVDLFSMKLQTSSKASAFFTIQYKLPCKTSLALTLAYSNVCVLNNKISTAQKRRQKVMMVNAGAIKTALSRAERVCKNTTNHESNP